MAIFVVCSVGLAKSQCQMSIGQWIILRLFRKHACKSLKVHRYVELTIEVYKEKERLCSPLGTSYFGFKAFFRRGRKVWWTITWEFGRHLTQCLKILWESMIFDLGYLPSGNFVCVTYFLYCERSEQ